MVTKKINYYGEHVDKVFPDQKQLITFSHNEKEQTIIGIVEEKNGFIYLYEYRGQFAGTEFYISFSKDSQNYKLIKVSDYNK
jgi:hypothetical protein